MIEVEHLRKTYGSFTAIHDLSFRVEAGEILGFLGPNGAGKTSSMRIITGYMPATEGTARVAGFDVSTEAMAVRQRVGYLPETPPLYRDMTVEGYLHFVAAIKGVVAGDRIAAVNRAINRCNLEEKRTSLIWKLSKGFKQRVGIAQAIVHEPPVIVLDEPTVGLDPKQINDVRQLIKSLAGDHTIILSTHILPEVSMTCDRVVIINRGQVAAMGTPAELTQVRQQAYELELTGEEATIRSVLAPFSLLRCEAAAAGTWQAQVQTDAGQALAAAIVNAGLGLQEMRRTQASLEDIFLQLITQEDSSQAGSSSDSDIENEMEAA